MPKKRYSRDKLNAYREAHDSMLENSLEITPEEISGSNPIHELEKQLFYWPPCDLRYSQKTFDLIREGYKSTDTEFMKDIAKGMDLRVTKRNLKERTIETVIELQSNLDEYERYNLAVQDHNEEWKKAGSPKIIMDPVHGEMIKVRDQYVETIEPVSSYNYEPDSRYSSTGPLAKARPSMKKKAYIRIVYKIQVVGDNFVLGYVAYDSDNRVVYYNEVTHRDMVYLVRRATQEIWGNPTITLKEGPFLEGIPMLIHGEKLEICKRDNRKPDFLSGATLKETNTEYHAAVRKQNFYNGADYFFRYVFPIGTIIFMILFDIWGCFRNFTDIDDVTTQYWLNNYGIEMSILFAIMILLVVSRKIARECSRRVSVLDVKKRFI